MLISSIQTIALQLQNRVRQGAGVKPRARRTTGCAGKAREKDASRGLHTGFHDCAFTEGSLIIRPQGRERLEVSCGLRKPRVLHTFLAPEEKQPQLKPVCLWNNQREDK